MTLQGYYSTKKVCELSGLSIRQINTWVGSDLIIPQDRTRGRAYVWSAKEAEKIILMARLTLELGMLPSKAVAPAMYAIDNPGKPVPVGKGLVLLIEGE